MNAVERRRRNTRPILTQLCRNASLLGNIAPDVTAT